MKNGTIRGGGEACGIFKEGDGITKEKNRISRGVRVIEKVK